MHHNKLDLIAALEAAIPNNLSPCVRDQLPEEELDRVISQYTKDWTIFCVDPEERTIWLYGYEPPQSYKDALDRLGETPDIERFDSLRYAFERAYIDYIEQRQDEDDPKWREISADDHAQEHVLEWADQLEIEHKVKYEEILSGWLHSSIDWGNEYEFFYEIESGQGAAYEFFRNEASDLLDALGIQIVEGDHPGSSYYAAELRNDVASANKAAADRGLNLRFIELSFY